MFCQYNPGIDCCCHHNFAATAAAIIINVLLLTLYCYCCCYHHHQFAAATITNLAVQLPVLFLTMCILFFSEGVGWGPMHWCHAVSKDAMRWTHMPIALAPTAPYDCGGVFSGSGGVYNNNPTLSYSVECDKVVALAVPVNRSDALLTNWTSPSYDPIAFQNQSATAGYDTGFR